MGFLSPAVLGLLAAVLVLAGGYVWSLRRRVRRYVRFSRFELLAQAGAAASPWGRHLPAGMYLVTAAALVFTLARPVATIPVPDTHPSVMLSIDVSASMMERDVIPTRLDAAKAAAKAFVRALPPGGKVGLVSFSDTATLVAPLSEHHDLIEQAIDGLEAQSATAIGDGLLEAVYALPGRPRPPAGTPGFVPSSAVDPDPPLPPAAVVLLSDGGSNTGTEPQEAARTARRLQVKVYTVGLGTAAAATEPLDEETLKAIAAITGGRYYRAASAGELQQAYRTLGRAVVWMPKPTELTGLASIAVALLLAATVMLSRRRMDRLG
jgi:Ca-activated chloride channel family protein